MYFDHSGDTSSRQVFLKAAHVAFRRLGGALDVQIGRMPYTSGAERASGVATIEAVKRQRVDSRLVGEFEWSLYQRAFDGIRVDWAQKTFQMTATAFRPTQGGFEEAAGVTISGVLSGLRATAADIALTTIGGHVVGARPAGAGEIDALLWTAGQFGGWYEQDHRAFGIAAEAGYQWPKVRWSPWLRGGCASLSGDGDAAGGTHGTFFPMLPTVRRYSPSTLYSLANLRDGFAQVLLRPRAGTTVRLDVHLVSLASRADAWYGGSGATQESGRIFG